MRRRQGRSGRRCRGGRHLRATGGAGALKRRMGPARPRAPGPGLVPGLGCQGPGRACSGPPGKRAVPPPRCRSRPGGEPGRPCPAVRLLQGRAPPPWGSVAGAAAAAGPGVAAREPVEHGGPAACLGGRRRPAAGGGRNGAEQGRAGGRGRGVHGRPPCRVPLLLETHAPAGGLTPRRKKNPPGPVNRSGSGPRAGARGTRRPARPRGTGAPRSTRRTWTDSHPARGGTRGGTRPDPSRPSPPRCGGP